MIFQDYTHVFFCARIILDTLLPYIFCFFFRVIHAKIQETVRFYITYPFRYNNRFLLFTSYTYSAGKSHAHFRTTELHRVKESQ
jgi:hypothetical protein